MFGERAFQTFLFVACYVIFLEGLSWFAALGPGPCIVRPEQNESATQQADQQDCPTFLAGSLILLNRADHVIERHDKSIVAVFTVVLAFSTIGLWLATVRLWRAGEQQMELIAANNAQQSRDMRASIDVATVANEISNKHMIADQRAWIAVPKMDVIDNIVFNDRGSAVLVVAATLLNLGKTPALNIHTVMEIGPRGGREAQQRLKEIAEAERKSETIWVKILLPNDSYQRKWALTISKRPGDRWIIPRVIGCVTYRIVPDNTIHQTGFDFTMMEAGPSGAVEPPLRTDLPVIPPEMIRSEAGPAAFAD